MNTPVNILLAAIGLYAVLGAIYAAWFVLTGAAKRDPVAANASLRVRLLFLPGALALWPLLLASSKPNPH